MMAVIETLKLLTAPVYPILVWGALFGLIANSALKMEFVKPSASVDHEFVQSAQGEAPVPMPDRLIFP